MVVSHHNRDGSTPVQFGGKPGTLAGRDRTKPEEYQKQFAHMALDTGADLVFGHGTHTVQGVEIYKGKPILYAIGHSNFDQPGYEKSNDGLVVRTVIRGKKHRARVVRAGDARRQQRRLHADPSSGEGATLVKAVTEQSTAPPALRIDGKEVVLFEAPARMLNRR